MLDNGLRVFPVQNAKEIFYEENAGQQTASVLRKDGELPLLQRLLVMRGDQRPVPAEKVQPRDSVQDYGMGIKGRQTLHTPCMSGFE
jgi:hypothetical protein